MKKKITLLLGAVCALSVSATAFAACSGNNETPVHRHVLFDHEAVAATCVSEGNVAYKECLYCGDKFVDDVKVADEDIILPIDSNNHGEMLNRAEVPNCVVDGRKAHQECEYCHELFIDGNKVTADQLVTTAKGQHTWNEAGLECNDCDAYKLLYNGKYHVIDALNSYEITALGPATSHASGDRLSYTNRMFENRNQLATQVSSTSEQVVRLEDGNWTIQTTKDNDKRRDTFTRFAYGVDGNAYVGRFLMTYNITLSGSAAAWRLGVKVVNDDSNAIDVANQSLLIGQHASEENNANRVLTPGVTYTFAYVIEVTAENQLIQIWNCLQGVQKTTISDIHFVNLDEDLTGIPSARMLYFGEAGGNIVKPETCAHTYAYDRAAKEPTCVYVGWSAHKHCPVCGSNTVDGEAATDVIKATVEHSFGDLQPATESTCTTAGHAAHYRCSVCNGYFDTEHNKLDGEPLLPLAAHDTSGSWLYDEKNHWKVCSVCNEEVELHAHIPGAAATEDTAQTCTECGFTLALPTGHVHSMEHTEAKDASCTEDGNVEYYYCSKCEMYYSDEAGTTRIYETVIPSEGHHMGELVEAKDATCTEDGNDAYYYCSTCKKYFADAEGETDIIETYLKKATGHSLTYHAAAEDTCYQKGHIAYSYCSACNTFFTDNTGTSTLTPEQVFTGNRLEHNYVDGVCTNAGCGAKQEAVAMTTVEGEFGNNSAGTTIKNTLVENPGTWAVQYGDNNGKAALEGGVLKVELPTNSKNVRGAFIRTIPAQNGEAFVGAFAIAFDFKITAAGTAETGNTKMSAGFFIQSPVLSGDLATSGETEIEFEIGKTYRFMAYVETVEATDFFQFTLRNPAGSNLKKFEVSNVSIEYYPEASKTGVRVIEKLIFAQKQEETQPAAPAALEAVLPSKENY